MSVLKALGRPAGSVAARERLGSQSIGFGRGTGYPVPRQVASHLSTSGGARCGY